VSGIPAQCADTNFTGAQMSGAQLQNAVVVGANFTCTDMTGANLQSAYVTDADLGSTNLSGVRLSGATLTNVTFADVACAAWNRPGYVTSPGGTRVRDAASSLAESLSLRLQAQAGKVYPKWVSLYCYEDSLAKLFAAGDPIGPAMCS
jgi:Pentapeptide repeats (8 copies)